MFYVLKYYQLALLGISALMILYGLLTLIGHFRRGGTKEVAQACVGMRKKWRPAPLILAVLVLNCFLFPAKARMSTSAEIMLNYHLASQGLNPNGSRFNQTDILNTQVLERTIEKGALQNITVEDLKDTLQVRPAVQGNSLSPDSYFISSQFVVSYNANERTAGQNGEKLLSLLTQAYQEWFIEKYSSKTDILNLDFTAAESRDYLDQCSFLSKTAESIGEYMKNMSSEEPAFRSTTNGETFQSMSSKAYAVSNTLVEKLRAYVLENSVSLDAAQYISRLNVANVFLDFDAQKAAASNENTLEAISMYANDMARIVLVPTYDTNDQFYMSQTRIGVDDFAATADHYATEKADIHKEMAENRHVISQLSQRRSHSTDEKAETLIGQIQEELTRLARQAKELVEEYNAQQANNYMTVVLSTVESQAKPLAFEIISLTAVFALGLYLCWFAFEERRKGKSAE